jgi:hypothetical protein
MSGYAAGALGLLLQQTANDPSVASEIHRDRVMTRLETDVCARLFYARLRRERPSVAGQRQVVIRFY